MGSVEDSKRIVQVAGVGLAANVALSALKIGVGAACASQTLVADGVHSFSDAATDIAVMVGSRFWSAPSDEEHPYGHRRIETIVTLFLGVALLMVGFEIVVHSVSLYLKGEFPPPPGAAAVVVALVSIGIKERLYRWTNAEGKRLQSPALVANAWHHRSDALSTLPALAALVAANVRPDWNFVDMLGAVLVSLFIFRSAVAIVWPACRSWTTPRRRAPSRFSWATRFARSRGWSWCTSSAPAASARRSTATSTSWWTATSPCAKGTASPTPRATPCSRRSRP